MNSRRSRYVASEPDIGDAAIARFTAERTARSWSGAGRDGQLEDVLVHAHTSLRARMNVSERTETAVLVAASAPIA